MFIMQWRKNIESWDEVALEWIAIASSFSYAKLEYMLPSHLCVSETHVMCVTLTMVVLSD